MQLFLPIFPKETRMVNFKVGNKQIDDFVHYFVNGLPVYCMFYRRYMPPLPENVTLQVY